MNHLTILCIFTISAQISSVLPCQMVSRAGWDARPPRGPQGRLQLPVPQVFIHHTAGAPCHTTAQCKAVTKVVQAYHQNIRRWPDIGYSFLIGGDGNVYEGVGWTKVGAHTFGHNSKAIAISFHGDFSHVAPTKSMLQAAQNLIQCGVRKGFVRSDYRLYGHRDSTCSSTSCPGNVLHRIIRTWPNYGGRVSC